MESSDTSQPIIWQRWHLWAFVGFVVVLSYLTFFHRYWQPPYVYWDENYHVASAQKYLHGVYFMEQHPPLGKLLIALGEKIVHPNAQTDQFLGTDYGSDFPSGFSFAGYRLFPALLAWLTAPVLFFCFYLLTRKNPLTATLFTFLYIFDNALIVHLRGAMLEGTLLFFASCVLLLFLLLWDPNRWTRPMFGTLSVLFGVAMGLMLTTKVLGLIFILLIPPLLWRFWPQRRRIGGFALLAGSSFLLVYCSVWYIHFARGREVNPVLPDKGYYQASIPYKEILNEGRTTSLASFPVMYRDSIKFISHYNNGAPRLDLCKADENGSPWYFWPVGARSINYRWETPDGKIYRYLYLQVNPVVWWGALLGLIVAAAMVFATVLFPPRQPVKQLPLLLVFLGIYAAYIAAVSRIDRVMYLYHYFIPLIITFFILVLVWEEVQVIGKRLITEQGKTMGLMIFGTLIFLSFQYYRPFTYYEPMSDQQVTARAVFPLWEVRCVNCEENSPLVVACREPGE